MKLDWIRANVRENFPKGISMEEKMTTAVQRDSLATFHPRAPPPGVQLARGYKFPGGELARNHMNPTHLAKKNKKIDL